MVVGKYFNTLRYLKIEQLFYQLYYKSLCKFRGLLSCRYNYGLYKEGNALSCVAFPDRYKSYIGNGKFSFLNITSDFNGKWDTPLHGDLWRYNLNYMDFILQNDISVAEAYQWIENYINNIDDNTIAADPYPISLRGMNWIKFASLHQGELTIEQLKKIDTSLYSQYRVLYSRTERHLLANHYLENGFSLFFASLYFKDKRFWNKSSKILKKQLNEQILADGAHFELSPMYHCVILEHLLDCLNVAQGVNDNQFAGFQEIRMLLHDKAVAMLSWLDAIVVEDTIPLLNDAAYNVAITPNDLREYAKKLNVTWKKGALGVSGYKHIDKQKYELIADMASLGVSYNLGHAHADTSTFLLWIKGSPFIVDTGTSTYNSGVRRNYERSTRAHNTVVINDENSSQVWDAFRCAKRAEVEILQDSADSCKFRHNGYANQGVSCCRQFKCTDDRITVTDSINGKRHKATAYFYLAPDIEIEKLENKRVLTKYATFEFNGCKEIKIEQVQIAREYYQLLTTNCICVQFEKDLKTVIAIEGD